MGTTPHADVGEAVAIGADIGELADDPRGSPAGIHGKKDPHEEEETEIDEDVPEDAGDGHEREGR